MMDRSVSVLRQWWITGPAEDEGDRVYRHRPSKNDVLSTLESMFFPKALARINNLTASPAPCIALYISVGVHVWGITAYV